MWGFPEGELKLGVRSSVYLDINLREGGKTCIIIHDEMLWSLLGKDINIVIFLHLCMQMWKEFKLSFCRFSPKAMLYFNSFSVTNENKDAKHLNILKPTYTFPLHSTISYICTFLS